MRESALRFHRDLVAVRPLRFFLLASPLLLVGAIWAQAPSLAFEVASIRAAEFPNPGRGGGQQQQFRAGMQLDAGRLDWGFASLAEMIQYAFRVNNYQVSGPDWIRGSRWHVVARLPEGASKDSVPEMMQALLAERFHLKVHHEKRNQPVYALAAARGGAHLEAAAPSSDDPLAGSSDAVGPGFFPSPFGREPGAPPPDGANGRAERGPGVMTTAGPNGATARISPGNNCSLRLELSRFTMQDLADTLTPFLDKPVIDATELKGSFHATLDLPMEVMVTMMQNMMRTNGMPAPGAGGPGRGLPDGGAPGGGRGGPQGCDAGDLAGNGGVDTSSAAIFKAVQKLGLKLEARKAPFDTVIIDRIEKTPSDN